MADTRTLVRLLDELLWTLRREGFELSTAQAIDVARAAQAVGLERSALLRDAVAAVVVERARDRGRFDAVFDAFFHPMAVRARATLWERLAARGFAADELNALRALLVQFESSGTDGAASLGALLHQGAELDRLLCLAGALRGIDAQSGPVLGFRTHRLLAQIGAPGARRALSALRAMLHDALGQERAAALAEALSEELALADGAARRHLRARFDARVEDMERERGERRLETTPFSALSAAEVEDVRRAVRRLADRLRGGARVRARRALRGRIDPHRTLRRALRTGGVPFAPAYERRRRDRPKLVLLCDVSDSVRAAACFLLELTYAAQEIFGRARSFVFVSDLGETTKLFEREPIHVAVARAWGGHGIGAAADSNYGRVLRTFVDRHLRDVDRRTTVVILGDGRTNYLDPAADALERIRERSRALLWLCPEPRGEWSQGDSAMSIYAPLCTAVHEVRNVADLERAARAILVPD